MFDLDSEHPHIFRVSLVNHWKTKLNHHWYALAYDPNPDMWLKIDFHNPPPPPVTHIWYEIKVYCLHLNNLPVTFYVTCAYVRKLNVSEEGG